MEHKGRDYNTEFTVRSEEGKPPVVEGYFVKFGDRYELFDGAYETISRNAFDNTLNRDIVCLWNHDTNYPLARTGNGTLTLRVDDVGLYGKVEINPNDKFAADVYERIKRQDVRQCSFGFRVLHEEKLNREDGVEFRINEVELFEVSPVTFPAYKDTVIQARKAEFDNFRKAGEAERRAERKKMIKERIDTLAKSIKA